MSPTGRTSVQAALAEATRAALHGTGAFLVLEGEAGIGKSTLVQSAARAASGRGLCVAAAAAREMQRHRPFGVVVDALRAGGLRVDPSAALAPPVPHQPEPEAWAETQYRVEESLLEMIEEASLRSPLLLVVEDLHWADPASLMLLDRLVRRVATLPLAVVGTARPLPRGAELTALLATTAACRHEVGPMDEAEAAQVAADVLGARPGATLRSRLTAAGGNPLFIREMLDGAVRESAVRYTGAVADLDSEQPLPSFTLAVLDRLSYLSRETIELLSVAAVLGSQFSARLLGAVTGKPLGALWPALEEARRARLIEEHADELRFRHDLIRDALYDDLPLAVRQAMHADAAAALERLGSTAESVADHLLLSTEAHGSAASARLHRAGTAAARAGAPRTAADLLRAALDAAPALDQQRAGILADLGLALVASGEPVEGERVLREVLTAGVPAEQEAAVRLALQQGLQLQGRLTEGLAEAEAGAASTALSARDRARFEARASMGRLFLGDVEGALATALSAERAAKAAGDVAAEVRAVLTRAHIAGLQGRFEESVELTAAAVAHASRSPSVETYASLPHHVHSGALADVDDLDGALRAAGAAEESAGRLGVADSQVMALLARGQALFSAGQCDDALPAFEAAVALAEETGTAWQVEVHCLAALAHEQQGRRELAEVMLQRAEEKRDEGQPAYRLGWIEWVHAVLADDAGRPEEALDILLPVWRLCQERGLASEVRRFAPLLVRAAIATGRPEVALEAADALSAMVPANPGVPALRAAADHARGLATDDPELLLAAAAAYADFPRLQVRARWHEECAVALARLGRDADAREQAEHAVTLFSEIGADGDLARCRAALRGSGLRLGVRGARGRPTSGWAALTATEAEVARLVARRMSNPEVAERMFLSRRTVGHHVSRVLAKLGMTSRTQLAAAADRGPLEDL